MQVIRTKQFHIEEPTAVAMGKFDSLHLGHKVILDRMKREAECSLRTVVVSFEPGPEVFFGKYNGGFDRRNRKFLCGRCVSGGCGDYRSGQRLDVDGSCSGFSVER